MRGLARIALATLLGGVVVLTFAGCGKTRRRGVETLRSPDGKLTLKVFVDDKGLVNFEIRDRQGNLIQAENTGASVYQKYSMWWESDAKIVLDSSDIGIFHWQRGESGYWVRYPRIDEGIDGTDREISPDGTFEMRSFEKAGRLAFIIRDVEGYLLYEEVTEFPFGVHNGPWWDSNDSLALMADGAVIVRWKRQPDGTWKRVRIDPPDAHP